MDRRAFSSLLLGSGLAGAPFLVGCQGDPAYRLIGTALPLIKGVYSNGQGLDLGLIKRPAIIRVWGLWCTPCIVDEPNWQAVIRGLRTGPMALPIVNLMAIHVGRPPANGPTLSEWVAAQDPAIAVPQVDDATTAMMTAIGIPGTPSTLIIDDNGIIRDHSWQFRNKRGVDNFLRKVAATLK